MKHNIEQWVFLTDKTEIFFLNCYILIFFIYTVRQFLSWNSKEPVGSERLSMRRGVKLSQPIEDTGY